MAKKKKTDLEEAMEESEKIMDEEIEREIESGSDNISMKDGKPESVMHSVEDARTRNLISALTDKLGSASVCRLAQATLRKELGCVEIEVDGKWSDETVRAINAMKDEFLRAFRTRVQALWIDAAQFLGEILG